MQVYVYFASMGSCIISLIWFSKNTQKPHYCSDSSAQGFKSIAAFFNSPYYRQNLKVIGMFEFECLEIISSKISEVMIWTPFISKNQSWKTNTFGSLWSSRKELWVLSLSTRYKESMLRMDHFLYFWKSFQMKSEQETN